MNRARYVPHIILAAVLAMAAVTGCQNPAGMLNATPRTGRLSVALSAVSPVVTSVFQPQATLTQAAKQFLNQTTSSTSRSLTRSVASPARAYLAASSVDFTLLDSSGAQVTTWSDSSLSSFPNTGGNSSPASYSVPEGNGYTLKADIYNSSSGTAVLEASGTSPSFNISASSPSGTPVSIVCVPVNASSLAVGTPTTVTMTPWQVSLDSTGAPNGVTTIGGEQWYQVTLSAGGNYVVNVTPSSSSAYAGVFLFDSTGHSVAMGGGAGAGQPATTYLSSSGTYYVGVIVGVGSSSTSTSEQATVSVDQGMAAPLVQFAYVTPNTDLVDQQVLVGWQGPTSGVTYEVQRSTSSSFSSFSVVSGGTTSAADGTPSYLAYDAASGYWMFGDPSVGSGQSYYYRVVATDTASSTPYTSNVVTAPIASPATVTWTTDSSLTGIQITWSIVTGASDYDVEIMDSNGNYVAGTNAGGLTSYVADTGSGTATVDFPSNYYGGSLFTNGQTYYVWVAADNSNSQGGVYSLSGSTTYTGN